MGLAGLASRPAPGQPANAFRPARIVVSTAAGSAQDLCARLLAEGLSRRRGHPVVVENRPSAGGIVAAEAFAQARPGEALFFSFIGVVTLAPFAPGRLPYDPEADLVPVHAAVTEFLAVAVPAASPARSLAEFVDLARGRPGALSWFTQSGSAAYLTVRDFMRRAGDLDVTYVSYRGTAAALPDLSAGRLDVIVSSLATMLPLAREGQIRLLAVTNPKRSPLAPEVPTAVEAGFPALQNEGISGLFGWRGMPEALRMELAEQARSSLAEPTAVERLRAAGMEARDVASPAAFAAELAAHRARWAPLAREFGAAPPG
jgi:tripartite-type tricarboxylate transporter receptor subunit TctC